MTKLSIVVAVACYHGRLINADSRVELFPTTYPKRQVAAFRVPYPELYLILKEYYSMKALFATAALITVSVIVGCNKNQEGKEGKKCFCS